jgi:hypothetical protein
MGGIFSIIGANFNNDDMEAFKEIGSSYKNNRCSIGGSLYL